MLFSLNKYILITIFALASCSDMKQDKSEKKNTNNVKEETFKLHTSLNAISVENNYKFCDTSLKEDMNCFVSYKGNRYLKKEKIFYDSLGRIGKVMLYKPEGTIEYSYNELRADSLFVKTNMLKLNNNTLTIKGDSIIYPVVSKIIEFNKAAKKIYFILKATESEREQLCIYDFW